MHQPREQNKMCCPQPIFPLSFIDSCDKYSSSALDVEGTAVNEVPVTIKFTFFGSLKIIFDDRWADGPICFLKISLFGDPTSVDFGKLKCHQRLV